MDASRLRRLIPQGEGIDLEFKAARMALPKSVLNGTASRRHVCEAALCL